MMMTSLKWLKRRVMDTSIELQTVIALAAIAAGILIFGGVAEDVLEGAPHKFDTELLLALR